jgi:hypothetical protein
MFFSFSWIFLQQEKFAFLAQMFEDQRWRGKPPTRWILFILLSVSPHQIERIDRELPVNSSCDDIGFVLASLPNEVRSSTPHHRTPHTRDTLKTGRDWPVMSANRSAT